MLIQALEDFKADPEAPSLLAVRSRVARLLYRVNQSCSPTAVATANEEPIFHKATEVELIKVLGQLQSSAYRYYKLIQIWSGLS